MIPDEDSGSSSDCTRGREGESDCVCSWLEIQGFLMVDNISKTLKSLEKDETVPAGQTLNAASSHTLSPWMVEVGLGSGLRRELGVAFGPHGQEYFQQPQSQRHRSVALCLQH